MSTGCRTVPFRRWPKGGTGRDAVQWLALSGVILTFATVVTGFLQLRRKVAEVHVLVNSQLSTVLQRVAQLTSALEHAEIEVPPEDQPGGRAG